MSTAKTKAKQPAIIYRREAWADVDDEIRDAKARIKKLDAEYADAEHKLDDPRWHATGKALGTARSNLQALETKRAEIMAGIYVEPVVVAPPPPQKAAQPATAAELKYLADETAALKEMGLGEKARDLPYTHGEFAVFYKHLVGSLHRLRDRVEALEDGSLIGVKYLGTYQRALPYQRGSCVTYQSSMWTALADVPEGIVPGNNATLWQLSSKGDKPVTKPRASK